MLPNLKTILAVGLLALLAALLMSGAMHQDEMPPVTPELATPTLQKPVAVCTECYYREPTRAELELAERVWQEAWGEMTLQERMAGVVLEPIKE